MAWQDLFEDDASDFTDVTNPYQDYLDFEGGGTTEFDSVTDADSDMNATTGSKRDGTYGLELTYDDNNVAYGTINLSGTGATTMIAMDFNANDFDLGTSGSVTLCAGVDSGGQAHWRIRYQSDDTIDLDYYNSSSVWVNVGSWTVTSGWHRIHVHWYFLGGGVGMYVDGELEAEDTIIAQGFFFLSYIRTGIVAADGASPSGSFFIDNLGITEYLEAATVARLPLTGTHALVTPSLGGGMDSLGRFYDTNYHTVVTLETQVKIETWDSDAAELYSVMAGESSSLVDTVRLQISHDTAGDAYYRAVCATMDVPPDAYVWTSWYSLPPGVNTFRIIWVQGTATGSDDGECWLYCNGKLMESITDVDSYPIDVWRKDFGLYFGWGSFMGNSKFLVTADQCRWADSREIPARAKSQIIMA